MMQSVITSKAFGAQSGNFKAWSSWIEKNIPTFYDVAKVKKQIKEQNKKAKTMKLEQNQRKQT